MDDPTQSSLVFVSISDTLVQFNSSRPSKYSVTLDPPLLLNVVVEGCTS
jgi:hypothetical protein